MISFEDDVVHCVARWLSYAALENSITVPESQFLIHDNKLVLILFLKNRNIQFSLPYTLRKISINRISFLQQSLHLQWLPQFSLTFSPIKLDKQVLCYFVDNFTFLIFRFLEFWLHGLDWFVQIRSIEECIIIVCAWVIFRWSLGEWWLIAAIQELEILVEVVGIAVWVIWIKAWSSCTLVFQIDFTKLQDFWLFSIKHFLYIIRDLKFNVLSFPCGHLKVIYFGIIVKASLCVYGVIEWWAAQLFLYSHLLFWLI